ncbi:MAG: cytochrome c [Flavobacterium sp.]|nr:MAG: cytochrome c [Flavobacterium sp.]
MKSKIVAIAFVLSALACSTKKPVADKKEEAPAVSTEIAEGKSMFENNCARCHKLFSPTAFTREQWEPILVKMQRKAKLDDAQMAQIRTYIFSQAR